MPTLNLTKTPQLLSLAPGSTWTFQNTGPQRIAISQLSDGLVGSSITGWIGAGGSRDVQVPSTGQLYAFSEFNGVASIDYVQTPIQGAPASPSWVSGVGLAQIRSIVKGSGSFAVTCIGDSKTETVNPAAGRATTNAVREIWSAQLQELFNSPDVQVIDVPCTYHDGTGNGLMTGFGSSGSVTHTQPKLATLATATTGAVAYFFPQGLNHVAVALAVGSGNFSTCRVSVYTGNVTGAIPAAGTATNRVADWQTDTNAGINGSDSSWFLASLRVNSWADNIIQKDAAGVAFEGINNVIIKVAENVDMGVTSGNGCTVVVYNIGGVQTGLHRIIGKKGGATFQDQYKAVLNVGAFGQNASVYLNSTAAASDRDYYGGTTAINLFAEQSVRWLKSQQPVLFGTDNKTGDLGGQVAGFDNVIATFSLYTNRTPTLPEFSVITTEQINAEVALAVALCQKAAEYGVPFVYFELMAINSDAGYRSYMEAMKAAISAQPNGVFLSVPEYISAKFGLTVAQARDRATVETALGAVAIDAADGSNFHTGRYGQHLEAEAIKGLFRWAMA